MENPITLVDKLTMIVDGVRPADYQFVVDQRGVVHSSREQWLDVREAEDPHDK